MVEDGRRAPQHWLRDLRQTADQGVCAVASDDNFSNILAV